MRQRAPPRATVQGGVSPSRIQQIAASLLEDEETERMLSHAERVYAEQLAGAIAALGRPPATTYAG